jgi:hypothetical protein
MSDLIALLVGGLTAVTLAFGLVGLAVRYALLPWLREHLVIPVNQVKKQVTENHHANETPTIPDRIDDVAVQVFDASLQIASLARMFDGHLEQAAEESRNVWRAIDRLGTTRKDTSNDD